VKATNAGLPRQQEGERHKRNGELVRR
jgi:hypothetical protein